MTTTLEARENARDYLADDLTHEAAEHPDSGHWSRSPALGKACRRGWGRGLMDPRVRSSWGL